MSVRPLVRNAFVSKTLVRLLDRKARGDERRGVVREGVVKGEGTHLTFGYQSCLMGFVAFDGVVSPKMTEIKRLPFIIE